MNYSIMTDKELRRVSGTFDSPIENFRLLTECAKRFVANAPDDEEVITAYCPNCFYEFEI